MLSHFAKALMLGLVMTIPLGSAHAAKGDYANPHLIVSPGELATLIGDNMAGGAMKAGSTLRIIDARAAEKFASGHVPGAISIPFTDMTDPKAHVSGALRSDAALAELFGRNGIDHTSRVVIYDDVGGFRASRLFWVLEYFGHRQVSLLDGGIQAWTAAGHALKTGDAAQGKRAETQFSVNLTPRRYASADYILERRDDENTVVIDVRPTSAYTKGHIPWAINMPWKGNLTKDGTMKPAAELIARYEAAGVATGRNVVIHCQTGEASAHTYFTLRLLGYPRVRTYHRSWAEWGASDDLPKALASGG